MYCGADKKERTPRTKDELDVGMQGRKQVFSCLLLWRHRSNASVLELF